jgi:hypothetical protein
MVIPHHEGAIAMADLALTRASQTKENARIRSWYRQGYGGKVPRWGEATAWESIPAGAAGWEWGMAWEWA